MSPGMYFNSLQKSLAGSAFQQAEKLAGRYYRISPEGMKEYRYDVKTLAYLDHHEVSAQNKNLQNK